MTTRIETKSLLITLDKDIRGQSPISFEMIRISEGRDYNIPDYYISKYPVTQKQWEAIMDDNPSYFYRRYGFDLNLQRPVENVSWDDCQEFIKRLNEMTRLTFVLPTEIQWTLAAFTCDKKECIKIDNNIDKFAWNYNNSNEETHEVGQLLPNKLGIYDMIGNVCEWCDDYYNGEYDSHVIRGGSYCSRDTKDNRLTTYRSYWNTDKGSNTIGFRLVYNKLQLINKLTN